MTSNLSLNFDENHWVIQIRRSLSEELDEEAEIPISIFCVPKTLRSSHPDSYIPQQIGLGPYHGWHPEFCEMERHKIGAARRAQKQLHNLKFEDLVKQLTKLGPSIRACYHKFLDMDDETLSWMMAIDASFILEFLETFLTREGETLMRVSSPMCHLVGIARRKSARCTILRDMLMLENQIPLFLLRKMLEFNCSSLELSDDTLFLMLMGLCEEISPLKMMEADVSTAQVSQRAHLLDFLYHMIVPKMLKASAVDCSFAVEPNLEDQSWRATEDVAGPHDAEEGKEQSLTMLSCAKQLFDKFWSLLLRLNKGPVLSRLMRVLNSKPVKVISKLPWTFIFSLKKVPQNKEESMPQNDTENNIHKPPLVEQITIPSVTKLQKAGVCFSPTDGGISTICFDTKTVTLYLPRVSLDTNSEVILRNLVAYEACIASGPLVFARYTELMNGIIDDEGDVRILRHRGIVVNHLKSDQEVANLWNGMSKSVRLTKVPCLDKVVEDVNKFYNGRWKVRAEKFMRYYVFGSWQFLTLLASIVLLMLMGLQAFCSVYDCARMFHVKTIQ